MSAVVDVVIVSYKPDTRLLEILSRLEEQTLPVRRIRLINTEQDILDTFLAEQGMTEMQFRRMHPVTELRHIRKQDYDHAGTRNYGMRLCEGADYVVMMTQDALPASEDMIRNLIAPFETDPKIAACCGRQLANEGATAQERYTRVFNYPAESEVRTMEDIRKKGIKAYFLSDVCAAYRKTAFEEIGGFDEPAVFNEDMVFAAHALHKGWKTAYAADACVYHSHSYTARQQFRRNFDLGVSQKRHPEVFEGVSSEGEGVKYVKAVVRYLKEEGAEEEIRGFYIQCAFRLLGYRLGKAYKYIPKKLIRKWTLSPSFWDKIGGGKKG